MKPATTNRRRLVDCSPGAFKSNPTAAMLFAMAAVSAAATTLSVAQSVPTNAPSVAELKNLSLEELMDIKVTSVSKKEESAFASSAAVHVITQEDIKRSGVTSLAESLRMSPGMIVARENSQTWAISARGFSEAFANKLLVMMDGRSLYSPLFSGVYWDVQDTMLEDVERVEVVRGPGATLWGANAVNGVINVITKSAKDTQGVLATAGGGSEERGFGGFRYGDQIGEKTWFRVYGKYFYRDSAVIENGETDGDDWWGGRGGFRLDSHPDEQNQFTFQGDLYDGHGKEQVTVYSLTAPFNQEVKSETKMSGGNLLGRWTHVFDGGSELAVQTYYDRTTRDLTLYDEARDTWDVEFHHRFPLGGRQEITWGGGYRFSQDDLNTTFSVGMSDPERGVSLISAFIQDEIALVPERLELAVGAKVEHNDFTGLEFQPGVRMAWTPTEQHTLWASVSRAVRTPSRAEDSIYLVQDVSVGPIVQVVKGNTSFDSETLMAYEIGFRFRPCSRLTFDVALFYNDYGDLRSVEAPVAPTLVPGPIPYLEVAGTIANGLYGETYGGELDATWQATDWWRLHLGYTWLRMHLHTRSDSADIGNEDWIEGIDPRNQVYLRSSLDLPANVAFDTTFRYVDMSASLNVPSYLVMDLRLAWRPVEQLELSVVGQNLLDDGHAEARGSTVEHSVYGKLTWEF